MWAKDSGVWNVGGKTSPTERDGGVRRTGTVIRAEPIKKREKAGRSAKDMSAPKRKHFVQLKHV